MNNACRICGNAADNRTHRAREMMFGMRDEFDYLECAACGTVQIAEIPDLARYYPPDYYSLSTVETGLSPKLKSRVAARLAAGYLLHGRSRLGRFIVAKRPWVAENFPASLREPLLEIDFGSEILDFGSGNGRLLHTLHYYGFRRLTGADAFIADDIVYPNGVRVLKRSLAELAPGYDLVMLHHSFEHLPNPLESLREIRRLLPRGRCALVRIPVAAHAWEKYGVNWVQLDAPRHLYLYTERSFRALAEEAGFEVAKVVYDSGAFQFFASEQYERDIPLHDERAFTGDFAKSIFTEEQFRAWEREAAELNREGRGDQACFYLRNP